MSQPNAQVPTPDEVVGKGIDKLVALRPRALRHINSGRGVYARIFAGWRAQAALMCRRLAQYAKNGRRSFASGEGLRFLAGSEFDTPASLAPAFAVGQVVLVRAAGRTGGTIRSGSRFVQAADDSSLKLFSDATLEAAGDTAVPFGATRIEVPLVATREGTFANRPYLGVTQTDLVIADDIVDRSAWTVESYEVGGGSAGAGDADIDRYASAFALGQYGPNNRAAIAGALRAGVKHAIAVDDPVAAALRLYIADASWGGSTRWAKVVRQFLREGKWIGFGSKVLVDFVTNDVVTAEAVCKVRDPAFRVETSSLDAAVQRAIRSYFDDRPDWNRWRYAALRGVVARADRRLLSCSSIVLKRLDGTVLAEPTTSSARHVLLADIGTTVTYQNPS